VVSNDACCVAWREVEVPPNFGTRDGGGTENGGGKMTATHLGATHFHFSNNFPDLLVLSSNLFRFGKLVCHHILEYLVERFFDLQDGFAVPIGAK
jgi:hypothetical protein